MQSRSQLIKDIVDKVMAGEKSLSYSALSNFKSSPKDYIDYCLKTVEPTPAMVFGKMVHCLILEPDEFPLRYFVLDDKEIVAEIGGGNPRNTNNYKAWKQNEITKAEGKEIVAPNDYLTAQIQALNVTHNRAASKVLKMVSEHEKKIEWNYLNFFFRGILDGDGECVLDLKSCSDATPRKFQRTIIEMDYHIQAAMYLKGLGVKKRYFIIAMDSTGVSVHELSETILGYGMEEYDRLLIKFNECILNDEFNMSYDFYAERFDGIYVADKPGYLY